MKNQDYDIDELIGKYLAGEATVEEATLVKEWCGLSAENTRYFDNLQLIFEKAALVTDTSVYNSDAAWRKVKSQLRTSKKVSFFEMPALRIAASVLLVFAIGFWAYQQFLNPVSTLQLASDAIILQDSLVDGTKVVLNKKTELSITYNAKKKKGRIKLTGEATFDIKHDIEKELIVEADEVLIRDIGTTFNVKAYPESNTVEVSVQEGEVQFYTAVNKGIFVRAGNRGVYNKQTKTFVVQQADTNVVAYATRQFVFEERDLQTVVDALNAIYDTKIKISDSIKTCRVTVSFHNEEIETIAEILAETLNLRVHAADGEITLEGDGCE